MSLRGLFGQNGGFVQRGRFGTGNRWGLGGSGTLGQGTGGLFRTGRGGSGISGILRRQQHWGGSWGRDLGGSGSDELTGSTDIWFGGESGFGRRGRGRFGGLSGRSRRRNGLSLWARRESGINSGYGSALGGGNELAFGSGRGSGQAGRRLGVFRGGRGFGSSWGSASGSRTPYRSFWELSQPSFSSSRFGSPFGGWYIWSSSGPRGRSIWTQLNTDPSWQLGFGNGQRSSGGSGLWGQSRIR